MFFKTFLTNLRNEDKLPCVKKNKYLSFSLAFFYNGNCVKSNKKQNTWVYCSNSRGKSTKINCRRIFIRKEGLKKFLSTNCYQHCQCFLAIKSNWYWKLRLSETKRKSCQNSKQGLRRRSISRSQKAQNLAKFTSKWGLLEKRRLWYRFLRILRNSKQHSQQTFVGLQDVLKTSSRHVLKTSSTCLQRTNISFSKTSLRRLAKTSWKRLADIS